MTTNSSKIEHSVDRLGHDWFSASILVKGRWTHIGDYTTRAAAESSIRRLGHFEGGHAKGAVLADLLRRSVPGVDPTRPQINTLHFEGGHAISTDGHRVHRLPLPAGLENATATVPVWAIQASLASLGPSASYGAVAIAAEADCVTLKTKGGAVTCAQPEFAQWRHVHPEMSGRAGEPKMTVHLRVGELVRELRRLAKHAEAVVISGVCVLGSDESRDVVRFVASDRNGKRPEGIESWDADSPAWSGCVGLNVKYLLEAVQAAKWCKAKEVRLSVWGALDPVLLSWDGGDAVVMPMRIAICTTEE